MMKTRENDGRNMSLAPQNRGQNRNSSEHITGARATITSVPPCAICREINLMLNRRLQRTTMNALIVAMDIRAENLRHTKLFNSFGSLFRFSCRMPGITSHSAQFML